MNKWYGEFRCPRCGKRFTVGPAGWGWKFRSQHMCSYSCMRAMEEDEKRQKPKKGGWKHV